MRTKVFILALIGSLFLSCENKVEEQQCSNEYCFYVTEVVPDRKLFDKTLYRFRVRDLCTDRMYYLEKKSYNINEFLVGKVYCGEY